MSHVTYAEQYGIEKGHKQGLKEGLLEGIKEGLKEGRTEGIKEGLKEGRTEGIKGSLRKLLLAKFPPEGAALFAEFAAESNPDRLDTLLQAVGLAGSLEDFRARISPSS